MNDIYRDSEGLTLRTTSPRVIQVIDGALDLPFREGDDLVGEYSPDGARALAAALVTWADAAPPEPLPAHEADAWPIYALRQGGLSDRTIERLAQEKGYATVGAVRHALDADILTIARFGEVRLGLVREAIERVVSGAWRP